MSEAQILLKGIQVLIGSPAPGSPWSAGDTALLQALVNAVVKESLTTHADLDALFTPESKPAMNFIATKARVLNRGTPPDSFLAELVSWGRSADDSIFATNSEPNDVFNLVVPQLGPWKGTPGSDEWYLNRKAAMLEIMRVLAGFESSWNWNEGADASAGPETPEEEEAGAWQISANSISFGEDLRALWEGNGIGTALEFQGATKVNHVFAMEYAARLFRHTNLHNGPLKNLSGNNSVYPWLSRTAMEEFKTLLS